MKKKKKTDQRKLRDYLDKLWSKLTKDLFGRRCEWCGKEEVVHSDHIINRWNFRTRWAVQNCVILCPGCHIYKKPQQPWEWSELVNEKRGKDTIDALRFEAKRSEKADWDQAKEYLEKLEKELTPTVFGGKAA